METILDMYDRNGRRGQPRGWQTMETAPKDGMHIIVADFTPGATGYGYFRGAQDPVYFCTVAHYWNVPGEEGFYLSAGASSETDDCPLRVTHWRPLYEPLSAAERAALKVTT